MTVAFLDDSDALRALKIELDGLHTSLNTVQILGVDKDDPQVFRWTVVSYDAEKFSRAVNSFTSYDPNKQTVNRTLAFEDFPDSAYWYHEWGDPGTVDTRHQLFDFSSTVYGGIKIATNTESLPQRLAHWGAILAGAYLDGGCTFWITLKHRLRSHDTPVVSALYVVFDSPVSSTEKRYAIAHTCREYLVDHVLRFYERQVEEQYRVMEQRILEFLREDPEDKILSDSIKKKFETLKPIMLGHMPIMIEGDRGTGKLTAARYLHEVTERGAGRPPNSQPIIINCFYFSAGADSVLKQLERHGVFKDGRVDEEFSRTVIFDDLHNASLEAQHVIYRLIDDRLAGRFTPKGGEAGPWFILTIAPSVQKALAEKRLLHELDLVAGSFRITLPTLHDRLGERDVAERTGVFREIVEYFGRMASKVVPGAPRLALSDEQLKEWLKQPWPGNYTELRHAVLQHVIDQMSTR